MRRIISIALFFVLSFSLSPIFTSAQAALTPTDIAEVLNATVNPAIPKAHEAVTIDIENSSYDLNAAMIAWLVNGKIQTSGKGEISFTFTTGNLGETSNVEVHVTPVNAGEFSQTFTFTPSDVSLIWQAETYTPPLYRGRALFTDEATAVIAAMPRFIENGKVIPKENLIYNWKSGGTALESKSGYGKYSLTFAGGYFGGPEQIDVSVSSTDGTLQSAGSLTLTPVQTQVLVYQNHPLYGLLTNNAVGDSFQLTDKEVSFVAIPFFFSRNFGVAPDATFDWLVNGAEAQSGTGLAAITLRQDSGVSGTSAVSVSVAHRTNNFQQATKQFSVIYNQ